MKSGKLRLYPEVTDSGGYFDISFRKGDFVVRATKYVGLIPLTDEVAIFVRPRASVENLFWIAIRVSALPARLERFLRTYERRPLEHQDPYRFYARSLATSLNRIVSQGLMKRYVSRDELQAWRGRPLFGATVRRYRAKGVRHLHLFRVTDLTADIFENRVLKAAAARITGGGNGRTPAAMEQAIAACLVAMERVGDVRTTPTGEAVGAAIQRVKGNHGEYIPALWLASLILDRGGVVLEEFGAARFESLLLEMPTLFEDYARKACVDGSVQKGALGQFIVRNGNVAPLDFFKRGRSYSVSPDIYFIARDRDDCVGVADVKYKKGPSRDDRYQMAAFCQAAQTDLGIFVCPQVESSRSVEYLGTMPGGISMHVVRLNLAVADMKAEECAFVKRIADVIESREEVVS